MLNITGIYVYFAKSLHFATKKDTKIGRIIDPSFCF